MAGPNHVGMGIGMVNVAIGRNAYYAGKPVEGFQLIQCFFGGLGQCHAVGYTGNYLSGYRAAYDVFAYAGAGNASKGIGIIARRGGRIAHAARNFKSLAAG